MEAKPSARWPSQRQPYVKQTGTDGQPLDIYGQQIKGYPKPSQAEEAHIPAERWNFNH
jgi:hypothetical protein